MRAVRRFGFRILTVLLLALAGLLAACQPMPTTPEIVGELRVFGPNITVNGAPAVDRMPIRSSDFIVTGPNSRARVSFAPGGFVEIGENTDPNFLLQWLSGGLCLVKFILGNGSVYGDTNPCDHQITDANGNKVLAGSRYILTAARRTSVLTLLSGNARAEGARTVTVSQREQVVMSQGFISEPRHLSDREIRLLLDWLKPDRFEVFLTSSKDVRDVRRFKTRFDKAALTFNKQPLVAVIRRPLPPSEYFGVAAGVVLESGQKRFTYDRQTAGDLCRELYSKTKAGRFQTLIQDDIYRFENQPRAPGAPELQLCKDLQ